MSSGRTRSIPLSPADRASRDRRIARAIKSGVSVTDAKSRFKCSESTIRDVCQQYGVPMPRVGGKP